MTTAVITVVHGRHDHLARQCEALARSTLVPAEHVVVAMADPAVAEQLSARAFPVEPVPTRVVGMPADVTRLPLAAARNLGARMALADGARVLVFLDVDCLPGPDLVETFTHEAAVDRHGSRLLCSPVTYLQPPPAGGYDLAALDEQDDPHPARPAPRPGEVEAGGRHELFWSLSFAASAATWSRIGGFHEEYAGYGAEDTDLGQLAKARGIALAWVGSARAYHQHHPTSSPPVEHLDDILRNGAIYRRRWGSWPMAGWLADFERMGLIARDAVTGDWRRR